MAKQHPVSPDLSQSDTETVYLSSQQELVFGGTFDPPHLGHVALVDSLQAQLPHRQLRLLPSARPPLKENPGASFGQRCEMLAATFAGRPDVIIDRREGQIAGPSYSLKTLQALAQEQVDKQWLWVVGSDAAIGLERWWQWQLLKDYCHLLVFNRPGYAISEAAQTLQRAGFKAAAHRAELSQQKSGQFLLFEQLAVPQSSTAIRAALAKGELKDEMLVPSVINYIDRYQLYRQ